MYVRTPNSSYNTSMLGNESCVEAPAAPQPEVCLEHLWTEPAPTIRCVCVCVCVCVLYELPLSANFLTVCWWWWSLLYSAILHSRANSLCFCCMWLSFWMSDCSFYITFLISIKLVYIQCCLVVTWLVPCETAAVSVCSLYPMNHVMSLRAKLHT